MQQTTHYNFKKPGLDDGANIEIINENTDDIDGLLYNTNQVVSNLSTTMSGNFAQVNTRLGDLEAGLDEAETDIGTLETGLNAANDEINTLKTNNINAERVKITTQGVADLYSLPTSDSINKALSRALNLSSYMMFCANANEDSLDAAFGKGNEDRIKGLGLQLEMYSKFKGTTLSSEALRSKETLTEIMTDPITREVAAANPHIMNIMATSPYAISKIESWVPVRDYEPYWGNGTIIYSSPEAQAVSGGKEITFYPPYSGQYSLIPVGRFISTSSSATIEVYIDDVLVSSEVYNNREHGKKVDICVSKDQLVKVTYSGNPALWQPYFRAILMTHLRPYTPLAGTATSGDKFIWVQYFEGGMQGSWQTLSRTFKVHQAGTYKYIFFENGSYMTVNLMVNGQAILTGAVKETEYTINLSQGDELAIRAKNSGTGQCYNYGHYLSVANLPYSYPY